jgi:16S rRNA (cytosine1402-N4)-methyltransferase
MEARQHFPVLLTEVLEFLDCRPDKVYVDGTVGSGGHSRGILERSSPTGKLIGLDWDEDAIERAGKNLSLFQGRVELRKTNYQNLRSVLESLSIPGVDGILLDLGVSTEQLESRERGFSFRWDSPLDMRMSQETKITARDLLKNLSAKEIGTLLKEWGEERWAYRIGKAIVQHRRRSPLLTTKELVEVIKRSVPSPHGRIHPATRTFQALRIAVNKELSNLENFLTQCPDLLNPGGRLCVISYHSLEDRIVKNQFRQWAPKKAQKGQMFRHLTPRPVIPSPGEISRNPNARSAKMRAMEKIFENIQGGKSV